MSDLYRHGYYSEERSREINYLVEDLEQELQEQELEEKDDESKN